MTKFMCICVGGDVPDEKREQNNQEWAAFMASVDETGKMVDGAPFGPSKTLTAPDTARDFDWATDSDTSGYWIVEVETIDEAIALAKDAPHFKYGGTIEVRELISMR